MKINFKRLIVSLVIISSIAFICSKTSLALVPINPDISINKNILKINPWAIRCGNIANKAEERIANFEKRRENHYEIYVKLDDRLKAKIEEYEDTYSLDVSKLKEDLTLLEQKIAEYNEDYADYMSKLEAVKSINCDDTETDLTNALKDAREILKEVRKDVVDIKTFYWGTIRQDIIDLKKQINSETEE